MLPLAPKLNEFLTGKLKIREREREPIVMWGIWSAWDNNILARYWGPHLPTKQVASRPFASGAVLSCFTAKNQKFLSEPKSTEIRFLATSPCFVVLGCSF
jgi:hypothetical protein